MTTERRLLVAAALALAMGVGLMIPFGGVVPRILGVALLFGFIVLGMFAIASPQWLGGDDADRSG
jgi:hypothetical protein